MMRFSAGILICVVSAAGLAQQPPQATELPGQPFYVKKTWRIGGEGNWDYLTLDPASSQLFVAHGTAVQVVDVSSGTVIGEVKGLRDAHGIALDDEGQFGYISDGGANMVKVFDRHTLQVVASVVTGPNPRAIVFEPQSKLVFAICAQPLTELAEASDSRGVTNSSASTRARTGAGGQGGAAANAGGTRAPVTRGVRSVVTVIDAQTRTALTDLLLPGKLGFAQTDGRGQIFINITDRNQIAHFSAQAVTSQLGAMADQVSAEKIAAGKAAAVKAPQAAGVKAASSSAVKPPAVAATLDWTGAPTSIQASGSRIRTYRLGQDCQDPRGLAIDGKNQRLFAACENRKMDVLDAESGNVITTLPIGLGTDAVGYDANRGLIYTANGGGDGSVSVIRQHLSDSYALIQELPTFQRARTLAVNQDNGDVYLVTNKVGVNLKNPGGIGDLKMGEVEGSFEVLVIGSDGN